MSKMAISILNTLFVRKSIAPICGLFRRSNCVNNINKICLSTSSFTENSAAQEDPVVSDEDPLVFERDLPLLTSRKLLHPSDSPPKQAWLESIDLDVTEKLGIVDLHPEIFGVFPRIDLIWWNIYWQQTYKHVSYAFCKSRAELPGGGRKPWRQKGTGRARHGSIRSPLWHKGAKTFGPRGPNSSFFMLPFNTRLLGLRTALTIKYAQNHLHIIENLELASSEPQYLRSVVESKDWGLSVLFIDDTDFISKNMALASNEIKEYNVMPVYGLNVYSMLKHDKLILTLDALEKIEERLLFHTHSIDFKDQSYQKTKIFKSRI